MKESERMKKTEMDIFLQDKMLSLKKCKKDLLTMTSSSVFIVKLAD